MSNKREIFVVDNLQWDSDKLETIRNNLTQMRVPASLMMDSKVTTTISLPEDLSKKIDKLSKELDMTKSLLLILGFLFFLYITSRSR